MKHTNLRSFCSGILATVLALGCAGGAYAASGGTVEFNRVNLSMKGEAVFGRYSDLTLDSGEKVPSSILYVNENGGGTTYLPLAYISDLLDISVSWDDRTGTVVLGGGNIVVDTDVIVQDLANKWLVNGEYPKNSKGETYGPEVLSEITGHGPDLVLAKGHSGETGYIRQSEMDAYRNLSSDELIKIQESSEPYILNLYDSEGNVIDEVWLENGDDPSLEEIQRSKEYGNSQN